MANQSEAHSKLVAQALLEIGRRFHNVTAWKNHTGQAFTPGSVTDAINCVVKGGSFAEARDLLIPIRFGVVGQADISGIKKTEIECPCCNHKFLNPIGQRTEIEVKTGTGKLSDEQKNFRAMILAHGGLHIELRELKDLDQINQVEMPV